jgi:hypothetical protein
MTDLARTNIRVPKVFYYASENNKIISAVGPRFFLVEKIPGNVLDWNGVTESQKSTDVFWIWNNIRTVTLVRHCSRE